MGLRYRKEDVLYCINVLWILKDKQTPIYKREEFEKNREKQINIKWNTLIKLKQ